MSDGIRIFKDNKINYLALSSVSVLNGTALKENMLSFNPSSKWITSDLVNNEAEFIQLKLGSGAIIDSIIMRGHNFANYHIGYGDNNLLEDASIDLSNATYWNPLNATIASTSQSAGFYGKTMYSITENTSNGEHSLKIATAKKPSVSVDITYHLGFYIKAKGRSKVIVAIEESIGSVGNVAVDLTLGTVVEDGSSITGFSGFIEEVYPDFFRVLIGYTARAGASTVGYTFKLHNGTSTSYTGDGSNGIYLALVNFTPYPTDSYYSGKRIQSVEGVNGEQKSSIQESSYKRDTSFYKFPYILTDTINIVVYSSQVSGQQYYITTLICTEQPGRFSSAAVTSPEITIEQNLIKEKNINDKYMILKKPDSFSCSISLEVILDQADIDLVEKIKDQTDPVLLWLCGGLEGSEYFGFSMKPYRLFDIFRVMDIADGRPRFYKNIYWAPASNSLRFEEVEN